MQDTPSPSVIHDLNEKNQKLSSSLFFILLSFMIVIGLFFGYIATKLQSGKGSGSTSTKTGSLKTEGIADKKTFKDQAEGTLKEGGIEGEGNFHLVRPGGESQNVYLTSSTVDLSQYIGKKVRVWGETFRAEKAGWLMDVGLVELLQ